MTPYVVSDEESGATGAQKPTSIAVKPGVVNGGAPNGGLKLNGRVPSGEEDAAETPDSLPSRSSASGRSIIGNGKNGRSGALKRVSFGSSKGSMVETLVYDHLDDLGDLPPFLAQAPIANGDESRVVPAKVRVKFFESRQPVAQVACAQPSPDVTIDIDMTSTDHSPDYHRQVSHESGVDNPFRPDGELSREADTIVSLIKEGKPITPVKGEDNALANGLTLSETDSAREQAITPKSTTPLGAASKSKPGANGSTPKDTTKVAPGVVEVQRGVIVPPTDAPAVEQVVIKKKPKCKCCVIQ